MSMIPLGASSCAHKTILRSTEQWRIFVKTWFLTFMSVFVMVSTWKFTKTAILQFTCSMCYIKIAIKFIR